MTSDQWLGKGWFSRDITHCAHDFAGLVDDLDGLAKHS